MRDGVTRYDPEASGLVAATSWPLGTVLEVRGPTGRSMMLEVRDTGHLGQNHLDLSERDFMVLGERLDYGVVTATIRVLYLESQPADPFVGHNVVDGGGQG